MRYFLSFIGTAKGYNTPEVCPEFKSLFPLNASWACPKVLYY